MPYDSDEGFLRLIVPRVRDGLREGRRVMVATCARKLDLLADRLTGEAGRIDRRASSGWYLHPHRTLAAFHEYLGGRRTLIVGEPLWAGLSERETREWIRYESVVNAALGGAVTTILCAYDLRTVPPAVQAWTLRTHPWLLDEGGEVASGRYVEPHELVLDGDRAPLAEPAGEATRETFTARELQRLRRSVSDYARSAGMERSLIASLVLSVSEIAANSVEHGAGHGTITMWTNGREMVCEVADPGGALHDPLPGYIPPEPESLRGYGLWISRQLCDHVELRADGGTLRVRLHMGLG